MADPRALTPDHTVTALYLHSTDGEYTMQITAPLTQSSSCLGHSLRCQKWKPMQPGGELSVTPRQGAGTVASPPQTKPLEKFQAGSWQLGRPLPQRPPHSGAERLLQDLSWCQQWLGWAGHHPSQPPPAAYVLLQGVLCKGKGWDKAGAAS